MLDTEQDILNARISVVKKEFLETILTDNLERAKWLFKIVPKLNI
jgi:hypothetical protein